MRDPKDLNTDVSGPVGIEMKLVPPSREPEESIPIIIPHLDP